MAYKPSKGGHREAKKRRFLKREAKLSVLYVKRMNKQKIKNAEHLAKMSMKMF